MSERLPDDHFRRKITPRVSFATLVAGFKADGHLIESEDGKTIMFWGRRLKLASLKKNLGSMLPRPVRVASKWPQRQDKWSRYRRKCQDEGRCPHCGKKCWPWYECEERRWKKKLGAILSELVRRGEIERTADGKFCAIQK